MGESAVAGGRKEARGAAARVGSLLGWGVAAAALAVLYGPSLAVHLEESAHPLILNDDARQQIYHFHRFGPEGLFADDLISDYYLAFYPVFWKGFYAAAASAGLDPVAVSDFVPHVLMGIAVLALAAAAHRLGGIPAAWGSAAILLGAERMWSRVGGGLPHSFSLAVIALGMAALVHGRVRALAVIAALAPGLYPVAGVLLGGVLFGVLFVLPARDRGEARSWSLRRRTGVLLATAAVATLVALPSAIGSLRWGPTIGPSLAEAYPEVGRHGRYGAMLARPWPDALERAPRATMAGITGGREPWSPRARAWLAEGTGSPRRRALDATLLFALCAGGLCLVARSDGARRLLIFPLAAAAGHAASIALDPLLFLPNRYTGHVLPPLAALVVPAALGAWAPWPWARGAASILGTGALLLAVGGPIGPRAGQSVDVRRQAAVFEAIAETPPDSLIAGWPNGLIQTAPSVAGRSAFITYETHQALHAGFLDRMRERMNALIAAYFATTPEPLVRLRDEFGVTHLLVDPSHFDRVPPSYFEPFSAPVRRAYLESRGRSEVARRVAAREGRRAGALWLLDLADLGEAEGDAPAPR